MICFVQILDFEVDIETIKVIDITDELEIFFNMEEVEDIEDVIVVMVEKSQDEKEEKTKEVNNFKYRKF